jgi:amidophosphoribosyltransferase
MSAGLSSNEPGAAVSAVRIKLNPIRASVSGKRLVLVDDSIVRGTTSARIVHMLKAAGAPRYMCASARRLSLALYFGTDIRRPTSCGAAPHD